ncbi:pyridoxamine 5'-phosphate oxidase family protein [Cypionkella sp. TWP1-2-1b2]|uniref:pyridoxamine 5'-phosphate oxidase family protein n=1 Tax=Cypionkella sp. TWP1-2-1b2 TaxID=2804675 RepID=UPI003CF8F472
MPRQIAFRGGSVIIAVQGHATLIHDKSSFAEHWVSPLVSQGIDTVGMTLINVHAARIRYWDGEDSGKISV